jgi:hypothetical protein
VVALHLGRMAESSDRSATGSTGSAPSAVNGAGNDMAPIRIPSTGAPGLFLDPCCPGRRAVGVPLVRRAEREIVAEGCRAGFGGARAWMATSGIGEPYIWRHLAVDYTWRWRAALAPTRGAHTRLHITVYWVADLPNRRWAFHLRRALGRANRRGGENWGENERAAWEASVVDRADRPAESFAWNASVWSGASEGGHGIPVGLLSRAQGCRWTILAASPRRAWIRCVYDVRMRGPDVNRVLDHIRHREAWEQMTDSEDSYVEWVRQEGDTTYYGTPGCEHCTRDDTCNKCKMVLSFGSTYRRTFCTPTAPAFSIRIGETDLETCRDHNLL